MSTVKDSAAPTEQQRSLSSREFAVRWCEERGIEFSDEIIRPNGASFGPAGFQFINYDGDGRARDDLSVARYNRDENKYISPKGKGSIIYSPSPDALRQWDADEVWLAEGEGKTLALYQLGVPTLGVRGCDAWHMKGSRDLHPLLAERIQPGKRVNIVFDADWRENQRVHRGLYDCMAAVRALGGVPQAVNVPPIPGRSNTGIDDLIAIWRHSGLDVLRAVNQLERLPDVPDPYIVNLKEPFPTAQNFIEAVYGEDRLIHWQGDFYRWTGMGWERLPLELLREKIYSFIESAGLSAKTYHVNQIVDAARAVAQIEIAGAPCWLDGTDMDPGQLLACRNGLLNLATGQLLPHTPEYFNLSWSDVEYDPEAQCPRWEQFLSEIYPGDETARDTLQEFVGYTLTTDTSQQKAIAMIGPKRSGKGTVVRVVQALLGKDSYCAPTLASMGERFGLQTWIGKRAAFVADARASARNNAQAMVERVLTVTGEDAQHVDRKNREPWEGRLHTRLWLLSNQLPATRDTGAALVSRFLLLKHPVSFHDREDTKLEGKLRAELPGILNWSLIGLKRLRKRGHFVQPDSGQEMVQQWGRLNSPVLAFVQDCCEQGPDLWVTKEHIRAAYRHWCALNSVNDNTDDSHFTNDLNSATNHSIRAAQKRIDGRRQRVFAGIAVVAQAAQPKY